MTWSAFLDKHVVYISFNILYRLRSKVQFFTPKRARETAQIGCYSGD